MTGGGCCVTGLRGNEFRPFADRSLQRDERLQMIRDDDQKMGRPDSKMFACLTFWLAILIGSTNVIAQVNNVPMKASGGATAPAGAVSTSSGALNSNPDGAASDTIAPGTVITMQNWQQYKQFMPDGMVWLFGGQYFWKMPAD